MTMPLSLEAFLQYTLASIVAATALPDETAAAQALRAAAIAALFASYAPRDPEEALIVSQCITMQYALDAALRDLGRPGTDPKLLLRMRAVTVSMSRMLHSWVKKRDAVRAGKTRLAEPAKDNTSPRPVNAPMKQALLDGAAIRPVAPPPFSAILRHPGRAPLTPAAETAAGPAAPVPLAPRPHAQSRHATG